MKKAITLIVKRGALRRFDRLKRDTANLPVDVVWDRRLQERRAGAQPTGAERRQDDRRRQPSFTWDTAQFVAVERDED